MAAGAVGVAPAAGRVAAASVEAWLADGVVVLAEALLPDCVVVSVEAMVLPAPPWVPVPEAVGPGVAAPESLPPPPHAASTVSTASEASLKEGVETLMAINPNE